MGETHFSGNWDLLVRSVRESYEATRECSYTSLYLDVSDYPKLGRWLNADSDDYSESTLLQLKKVTSIQFKGRVEVPELIKNRLSAMKLAFKVPLLNHIADEADRSDFKLHKIKNQVKKVQSVVETNIKKTLESPKYLWHTESKKMITYIIELTNGSMEPLENKNEQDLSQFIVRQRVAGMLRDHMNKQIELSQYCKLQHATSQQVAINMSACFTASPSSLSFITLADVFRDHVMPTVSVGSPAHAARNLELLFKTDIPEPQVNKNVEEKEVNRRGRSRGRRAVESSSESSDDSSDDDDDDDDNEEYNWRGRSKSRARSQSRARSKSRDKSKAREKSTSRGRSKSRGNASENERRARSKSRGEKEKGRSGSKSKNWKRVENDLRQSGSLRSQKSIVAANNTNNNNNNNNNEKNAKNVNNNKRPAVSDTDDRSEGRRGRSRIRRDNINNEEFSRNEKRMRQESPREEPTIVQVRDVNEESVRQEVHNREDEDVVMNIVPEVNVETPVESITNNNSNTSNNNNTNNEDFIDLNALPGDNDKSQENDTQGSISGDESNSRRRRKSKPRKLSSLEPRNQGVDTGLYEKAMQDMSREQNNQY